MREKTDAQVYVLHIIYLNLSFVIFQFIIMMIKLNYESVIQFVDVMGGTLRNILLAAGILIQLIYYYTGDKTLDEMNKFKFFIQLILHLAPFWILTKVDNINTIIDSVDLTKVLLITILSTLGINTNLRILRKMIVRFTSYFKRSVEDEKDRILIVVSIFGIVISLAALFK